MPRGQRAVPLEMVCAECGATFTTTAAQPARYCAPECKRRAANNRRPADYRLNHDKVCACCGVGFRGRTTSVYCSRSCLAKVGWQTGRLKGKGVTHDRRAYRLRKDYGLTVAQYDEMLAEQGGVCGICGVDKNLGIREGLAFAVDHDHETGEVRGLLCNRCNRALGFWEDSVDLLRRALDYLENPPASR